MLYTLEEKQRYTFWRCRLLVVSLDMEAHNQKHG